MDKVLTITAFDLDGKNYYIGPIDVSDFKGQIEIEENLGTVRFKGALKASKSIITQSGSGIKARFGIEAGFSILVGSGIEAGENIKAGWNIKAGTSIKASTSIKAGTCIEAGENIKAGCGIKAGSGIEARTISSSV